MSINLTNQEFIEKVFDYPNEAEWKYKGDKPAIIDFWAEWCGPCKMVGPVLEEISEEYADKMYVYKINVDEETELAAAFGIQSIPSILFVPMEGQPGMSAGALPKETIQQAMKEVLSVE